jgi:hypothetical protein
MKSKRRPSAQTRIWDLLSGGAEYRITSLYCIVTFKNNTSTIAPRRQQQVVGRVISRINKRIEGDGLRIKPGEARGTYRLYRL